MGTELLELYKDALTKEQLDLPFTLDAAVEIIPMSSKNSLCQFLSHHKGEFPARYRWSGGRRPQRMLTLAECHKIREMTINEANGDIYKRRKRSVLDVLIQRARV